MSARDELIARWERGEITVQDIRDLDQHVAEYTGQPACPVVFVEDPPPVEVTLALYRDVERLLRAAMPQAEILRRTGLKSHQLKRLLEQGYVDSTGKRYPPILDALVDEIVEVRNQGMDASRALATGALGVIKSRVKAAQIAAELEGFVLSTVGGDFKAAMASAQERGEPLTAGELGISKDVVRTLDRLRKAADVGPEVTALLRLWRPAEERARRQVIEESLAGTDEAAALEAAMMPTGVGLARVEAARQTADGLDLTTFARELAGRSAAECEYYAEHRRWPEEDGIDLDPGE